MSPDAAPARFRLGAELGRGGAGVVYAAFDTELDRDVALKLMPTVGLDDAGRRRLAREVRAAQRLDHPHVIAVHAAGETEGHAWMAMELARGGTLRACTPLGVADAVEVARQLALALAHAHTRGIVHRDVKPENVLVVERDPLHVKLVDFGLATVAGASRLTEPGTVVGTFHYLAPEQALGAELDARADLYALGVVLYEALAGEPPFTGGTPAAIVAQHLRATPPPLHARVADVPPALEALVARLLAKDAAGRPHSAAEVAAELAAIGRAAASGEDELPWALKPGQFADAPIGRGDELTALTALLAANRLVTLTGPGGVGKTRLAAQLATEWSARVPVVLWVPLAGLEDGEAWDTELDRAAALRRKPAEPLEPALAGALGDRDVLVVFDNFEHLPACAARVAALLDALPRLRVLVTSRRPLGLAGEREFAVQPFASPRDGAGGPDDAPAIALFVRRARAARPDFAWNDANAGAVRAICARLDGLPLAIELAAARVRVLPPAALLDELERDATAGLRVLSGAAADGRTLRDTIRWSYDRLAPAEQALFRRLAVFAGSASLAALERACGAPSLLESLETLVLHSLVQRQPGVEDEARFAMLRTVREFALERLADAGEETGARDAHAAAITALAVEAEPQVRTAPGVLARLDRDRDNARVALERLHRHGPETGFVDLVLGLRSYWDARGLMAEGFAWLERACARVEALPVADRTRVARATGSFLHNLGDLTGGLRWMERALAWAREGGDERGESFALGNLGSVSLDLGDGDGARRYFEAALAIARRSGEPSRIGLALINLSAALVFAGDYAGAADAAGEAVAVLRPLGASRLLASALDNVAMASFYAGDSAATETRLLDSLATWRHIEDARGVARATLFLGRAALARGNVADARQWLVDTARQCGAIGERVLLADALEGLAAVRFEAGEPVACARLLGAVDTLRERTGAQVWPPDRPWLAALESRLAAAAPARTLELARAEGRLLEPAAALAFALD